MKDTSHPDRFRHKHNRFFLYLSKIFILSFCFFTITPIAFACDSHSFNSWKLNILSPAGSSMESVNKLCINQLSKCPNWQKFTKCKCNAYSLNEEIFKYKNYLKQCIAKYQNSFLKNQQARKPAYEKSCENINNLTFNWSGSESKDKDNYLCNALKDCDTWPTSGNCVCNNISKEVLSACVREMQKNIQIKNKVIKQCKSIKSILQCPLNNDKNCTKFLKDNKEAFYAKRLGMEKNCAPNVTFLQPFFDDFDLQTCRTTTQNQLKTQFIDICTQKLSQIKKRNEELFLVCHRPEGSTVDNTVNCKNYCEKNFENFYQYDYEINFDEEPNDNQFFITGYENEYKNSNSQCVLTCQLKASADNCNELAISYLAMTKDKNWIKQNLLGVAPAENQTIPAPLEGKAPLDKWINKQLFGAVKPSSNELSAEAQKKGFSWESGVNVTCKMNQFRPTECENEVTAAFTKASEACTQAVRKTSACCQSPISCASEETSQTAVISGFGALFALKEAAGAIHVLTGPKGSDQYEQKKILCKRMKEAALAKAGIDASILGVCQWAGKSCRTNCEEAIKESYKVFNKHCSLEKERAGIVQHNLDQAKNGVQVEYDSKMTCERGFFIKYQDDYHNLRRLPSECSNATTAGLAHLTSLGREGMTAFTLQQSGCDVDRPEDPSDPAPKVVECTGNVKQDQANQNFDCKPDCVKFPKQEGCAKLCTKYPKHKDCIDCTKAENKDHIYCQNMGGGGVDCSNPENKTDPKCLPKTAAIYNEEEEDDDLIENNPSGKGNPPARGLVTGRGGGLGLGGIGSLGGGGSRGRGGSKDRKPQSLLQGFKGKGQFSGYGGGGSLDGENPAGAGGGVAKNDAMAVDLGKYFKEKGRLKPGAHESIFERISKRFKRLCKTKMKCK